MTWRHGTFIGRADSPLMPAAARYGYRARSAMSLRRAAPRHRVSVNWPLFMAPPHAWPIMPPDIIPAMMPE